MITNDGSRLNRNIIALSSAVSLLGFASPALGQGVEAQVDRQEPQSAGQPAQEIIVTATRRSETVRDVPFNIQAITSETLEKTGATDIADFARSVPGLSFTDSGPSGGVRLVLRGLRTGSEVDLAATTAVYVDEVPLDMPYRGAPLDLKLIDIERIEVLRGPQGTLFGGGAIGGTVRYISKKPDLKAIESRLGAELSTTRHGGANYNVTGMINLPVADWIAIRANVGRFANEGFIDNVERSEKNVNDDKTNSARIAVLMRPVDNLDINLTYQLQDADYGEFDTQRRSRPPLTVNYANRGSSSYTAHLANLSVSYDFGWANLISSSSYVRERYGMLTDVTFEIRDSIIASFIPADLIPEFSVTQARDGKGRGFTQEVRLVSSNDGPFGWIIGGYYSNNRTSNDLQERAIQPFPGQGDFERDVIGAPLNDDKEYFIRSGTRKRDYAAFGEIKYNFTPAFQASIGGRFFDVRGIGDFYAIDQWFGQNARDANGLARTTPLPEELADGRYREKGSVWRFNTSYDVGSTGLVYATVAQGYRPGGFNTATPNTGIPPEGRQFESDDLVSYELGGKFSLLENRIYVSTALFRIDWSGIQTTLQTPLGYAYRGNAGKAVSQGVEIETELRNVGVRGLSLNLGYSFTDAKLTESIVGFGLKGERMPLVPRHTLSALADYSTEISSDMKVGLTWHTTYTSGSYSDFGPFAPVADPATGAPVPDVGPNAQYLPIRGYSLTNVSLRFDGPGWSGRIFADNLFDARFKTSNTYLLASSNFAGPDTLYTANRPRTIGIGFTKHF